MTAGIFFTFFGAFLTWNAVYNWRHRRKEKISVLEAAILRTTGAEPLPLTKFDRILQTFLILFASLFGPLFLLVGIVSLIGSSK